MFRAVIVEDDYIISTLNRSFLKKDGRFQVVGEFSSGREALPFLSANPVDLLVLDVYMPSMTGPELLRQLRAKSSSVDVIVVTAAHETQTLSELLKLGIVDYLVKPFTAQRFQQALDNFCQHRSALDRQSQVSQAEIDRLLGAPLLPGGQTIPKGLQERTLDRIRSELSQEAEKTCEAIAAGAGLSVVTTRRYLNFLLECRKVESKIRYDTGGRPCLVYWAAEE